MDSPQKAMICIAALVLVNPCYGAVIRESKHLHKRQIPATFFPPQFRAPLGSDSFNPVGFNPNFIQNQGFRPIIPPIGINSINPTFARGAALGPVRHTFSTIDNTVGVRVPQPVPVQILRGVPVPVRVGVPVDVPRAVRVLVPQAVGVPVARPVPVDVPRAVAVRVVQAVPVAITQAVGVPVPQPVPVSVPVVQQVGVSQGFPASVGIGNLFTGNSLSAASIPPFLLQELLASRGISGGQIIGNSFNGISSAQQIGTNLEQGITSDLLPPSRELPQGIGIGIGTSILNRSRFNLSDLIDNNGQDIPA